MHADGRGYGKASTRVLDLDRQHINGIWARIIKNAFAPLFQPQFDIVAGNPPWINWESLPDDYRQQTAPLWQKYGLAQFGFLGADYLYSSRSKYGH